MLLYNSKLIEIKALLMLIVLIKEILSKHFNASIGKHKMMNLQQVYNPKVTDSFRAILYIESNSLVAHILSIKLNKEL